MKYFSLAAVISLITLLLDAILLRTYHLWQSPRWSMVYWIDCPMHFCGGVAAGLFLVGLWKKYPTINSRLSLRSLVYTGVFLIAVLWEVKEVFEGVPALEREFNSYIWGYDFYYFNLIKDSTMALFGVNRVLRFVKPQPRA